MGARTYHHGFAITPDNANNLPTVASAVYVGATGNVNCILFGDYSNSTVFTNTSFVGVTAGSTLDIKVIKIWATGTTATSIVGLN